MTERKEEKLSIEISDWHFFLSFSFCFFPPNIDIRLFPPKNRKIFWQKLSRLKNVFISPLLDQVIVFIFSFFPCLNNLSCLLPSPSQAKLRSFYLFCAKFFCPTMQKLITILPVVVFLNKFWLFLFLSILSTMQFLR